MKSECVPYSQTPHPTKLFSDYLSYQGPVRQFYPRSPYSSEWMKDEAARIHIDPTRRERVAGLLETQNVSWGDSPTTVKNIARLRAGAAAVVTGQQVGLFGGPLFSIFKALTAVKLADLATQSGVDSVPIFWLATDDHDLAEVNQAQIPAPDYSLQTFKVDADALPDAPVGSIAFGPELEPVLQAAANLLGDSEAVAWLRESYRSGESFGSAFGRLFTRLFAEWGVILLNASDPAFHAIAEPIYRQAAERATELDNALLERDRQLEAAGYHRQVKVTPSSTLLFTLHDGARIPVHRRVNGNGNDFLIGEEKISQSELLARVAATPQNFSANVLLRPVIQDYLLPTLAYVGGAAEVAYFAQAAVVYEALLGRITPIVPRFSATIVENKPRALLERYGLTYTDLYHGPEVLRERMASNALPKELQAAFDRANTTLETSMAQIRDSLAILDKTLIDAADNAVSKMHHQLESLRARAARAELRQTEVLDRHAHVLSNLLFPNKTLQEREISGIYFVSRYGKELLHDLYGAVNADCLDHQVITL